MTIHSVGVILSTYNGEKYVEEQIESVLNQENVDVTLYIRDDGSTDNTVKILQKYKNNPNCYIYIENNVGVANSFFRLLIKTGKHEYYAFCDQDDVWEKRKLYVAIDNISKDKEFPAMYFSNTTPVDSLLNPLKTPKSSFNEEGIFTLRKILLRNNAIGCTIVFNDRLKQLIVKKIPALVTMHDHWIYALCLAVDGKIYFDRKSYILYRQHSNNVIGHKMSFKSKIKHSSFGKNRGIRCNMAKTLLLYYSDYISKKNKHIISQYAYYNKSIIMKYKLLAEGTKYALGIKNKILFVLEVLLGIY